MDRDEDGKQAHGVGSAFFDCIGEGWRVECLCGWVSCPDPKLAGAGGEFDDHLDEIRNEDD
jgi:hypothetical protein